MLAVIIIIRRYLCALATFSRIPMILATALVPTHNAQAALSECSWLLAHQPQLLSRTGIPPGISVLSGHAWKEPRQVQFSCRE